MEQCGNQIGRRFWGLALQEHANQNEQECEQNTSSNQTGGLFTESMSSFFRNVDPRYDSEIPLGNGTTPIAGLRARAILVDMEEGPVAETLREPIGTCLNNA